MQGDITLFEAQILELVSHGPPSARRGPPGAVPLPPPSAIPAMSYRVSPMDYGTGPSAVPYGSAGSAVAPLSYGPAADSIPSLSYGSTDPTVPRVSASVPTQQHGVYPQSVPSQGASWHQPYQMQGVPSYATQSRTSLSSRNYNNMRYY